MKQQAPINLNRVLQRIDLLATITTGESPGVTRLPFTLAWESATQLVAQWMREAGMLVRRDDVGNLIGRYEGLELEVPVLMIGSHLDTVIEGGKYDGALGVVTGLEVAASLAESGIKLHHPVEVVAFVDEEGVRFSTAMVGSRAMAGMLSPHDLQARDDRGVMLEVAMRQSGFSPDRFTSAARPRGSLLGYLELHVEQGVVLEDRNVPGAAVTGIAGARRYGFRIEGIAGHAGTFPMPLRRDALTGAGAIVLAVERIAREHGGLVATVGKLSVRPGAANVIPGLVEGTLDVRDMNDARRDAVVDLIQAECERICRERDLTCHFTLTSEAPAVPCSPAFVDLIISALQENGVEPRRLASGAGHDAIAMAHVTDIGMIFVRSKGGISHNPLEETSAEDIGVAAAVLRSVVVQIAGEHSVGGDGHAGATHTP